MNLAALPASATGTVSGSNDTRVPSAEAHQPGVVRRGGVQPLCCPPGGRPANICSIRRLISSVLKLEDVAAGRCADGSVIFPPEMISKP